MKNKALIGLPTGIVSLSPYTPVWKHLFSEEEVILQSNIGKHILGIQHVGSTSIPGMVAKPIIDIAIAIKNFEEAKVCIEPIERLGYQYKGEFGIQRRHYFVKGDPRTFHIHMNEIGSPDWVNQLLFRDYLISHPMEAQKYANLKIKLAKCFPMDRDAYLEGKSPFIQRILQLASSEA